MKEQDDMSERELEPCPFCSAGNTDIQERRLPPSMQGPGAIISVTVRHWCPVPPGQPSGLHVSMHGRDRESAIAAWNRRSPSRQSILEEAAKVADGYAGQARLAMAGDCMGAAYLRGKEQTADTIAAALRSLTQGEAG
jgi:hypothetical protein